jgi:hypothetical protein
MSRKRTRLLRSLLLALLATVGATLVLALSGATAAGARQDVNPALQHRPMNQTELAFHDAMRKLWEDHITWTRNVIISFEVNDPNPSVVLPDLNAAVGRLLKNQADIGNAIKPFYGDAAGDQLTALLRQHILGAADVLTALKTNNQPALQAALTAWYANAHDIAVFLSTANPKNWPLTETDQMMKEHLDATTNEAVARHQSAWSADVAAYDAVHVQILAMADMLSSGIIAQFPNRFHP